MEADGGIKEPQLTYFIVIQLVNSQTLIFKLVNTDVLLLILLQQ